MNSITTSRRNELTEFQKNANIYFKDISLLNHAFIHTSYVNENKLLKLESNERLEFLGDAILGLITSEYLYRRYLNYSEGSLTKLKSVLVSQPVLTNGALKLNIGKYILLGKGEDLSGGRERSSTLSNVFEAIIGAYFLDSGLEKVKEFVIKDFLLRMNVKEKGIEDYKSRLQEVIQAKYRRRPVYFVSNHFGPEHKKIFFIKVCFKGKILGKGEGKSKKEAEQQAAKEALKRMEKANKSGEVKINKNF